jgi:hypothetical protein
LLEYRAHKQPQLERRRLVTDYVWELGIDWNEVQVQDGRYFLQESFVEGQALAKLRTNVGDVIHFKIFDVTWPPLSEPLHVRSFCVIPKPAKADEQPEGDPFDALQPSLPPERSERLRTSVAFGGSSRPFPVWEFPPVQVTTPGHFLLSFLVQSRAVRGKATSRLYGVDPEMVVGPNAGSGN